MSLLGLPEGTTNRRGFWGGACDGGVLRPDLGATIESE